MYAMSKHSIANRLRKRSYVMSCMMARLFLVWVMLFAQTLPLMANPIDGVVSAGSADIASSGTTLTVTQQTDKAVIDWRGFDIAHGETTNFVQPNTSSMTLNRVNSDAPSFINGNLNANGNLIVVNPNGVWFGAGARVDVNGLIASTADIGNDAFMNSAGTLDFDKAGNPEAAIVNDGLITAKDAGLVGMVAPNVINRGVILAKLGRVHLASGDTATVDMYGDGLLNVAVSDKVKSQLVENSGVIAAEGGTIAMTAAAGKNVVNSLIKVSGELHAPSIQQKNGKIIIAAEGSNAVKGNVAANKGKKTGASTVVVDGVINASGRKAGERGGKVEITGDNIALLNGTVIDASGSDGASGTTFYKAVSALREGSAGGDIRIGGDYLGQGDTATAKNLYVDAGVLVLNDALNFGDAGRTIFWSDDTTSFYGNVYARALGGKPIDVSTLNATAGGNVGDGGFVETSGHEHLDAGGYVDLTASNGERGTYFLDPTNITIYGNFDPTDVAGLNLWLDATQITGRNNGDTLNSWTDVSGAGNTAGTSGNNPTYNTNVFGSLAGVNFSTTSSLIAPGFNIKSAFIIAKNNNANFSDYEGLLGGSIANTNNGHILNGWAGSTNIYTGASVDFSAWQNGVSAGGSSTFTNINAAGGWQGSFVSANSHTNDSTWIGRISGGNRAWNGAIGEIITYSNTLSTDSRNLLEQYQSTKWGIALDPIAGAGSEVSEATGATGYSAFTTRYLERLSQSANISLQATNNISLDLQGDTLNFSTSGRSLTLTAGNQISTASAGTITTNNGAINLNATNGIVFNHDYSLNSAGGNIAFNNAVNGAGALTVNAGVGMVSFMSTVGATTPLGSLTVTGSTTLGGDITTNNGNITFNSAVTSSVAHGWNAGTGNIALNSTYTGTSGNLTLSAAQIDINNTLNVGTNTLTLKPTTAKAIRVGRSTDNGDDATYLDISAPELARIQAGTVSIGDAALASPITVADNIDLTGIPSAAGVYNLAFNTAATFDSSGYTINLGRDALLFDGSNDYISINDSNSLDFTNGFTFSLWMKSDGYQYGRYLLSKRNDAGSDNVYSLLYGYSADQTQFYASGNSYGYPATSSNIPVADTSWHQITYTYNGSTFSSYKDGALVGSTNTTADLLTSNSNLLLGTFNGAGFYFRGLMDDVKLYNTAIDAASVSTLYNAGAGKTFTTNDAGLKAAYSFAEGNGSFATDYSGNSNTGTLINGPTWVRAQNFILNAGGAATLGNIYGDGSNISVTANDLTLTGTTAAMGDGTLSLNANRDLTVNAGAVVNSIGQLNLTADADGNNSGVLTYNAGTLKSSTNAITLAGAQMDINSTLNVGTATLTLKPTTSKAIRVGRSTDNGDDATYLDISAPELARIQAGTVSIGDAALASPITIAGNLDLTGPTGAAGVYNLNFNTAGTFNSSGYTINLGRDALSFDGVNDAVNLGNGNLNPTGAITLSAWIYIDGANNNYGSIFTDWGTSSNPYYVGTQINNSSAIEVYFNSNLIFTVLNNPLNSWMNLTVTNDGSTVNAYRNGVLVNSGAGTLAAASNGVTAVGYDINRSNYAFKGNIDDARIYNTVLDTTAISTLYNGGAGAAFSSEAGLLAGYNFSAGSGASAADISLNSNTGTLTNGPTWVRAQNLTVNAGGAVTMGAAYGDGSDISITGSAVTLAGKVAAMGDGTLNIASTNNITINNGASANAGGTGNSLVVRSSTGNFINNSTSSALSAPNGRWIVYSQNAGANTLGGLTPTQTINSQTYGTLAPAAITGPTYNASQNTFVYSSIAGGVLRFTADNQARYYGDMNPLFTYTFWCSTGCNVGDAVSGTPTLSTAATQDSNVNTYAISVSQGALSLLGGFSTYTFDFVNGLLTVDPRVVTAELQGSVSKTYDRSTTASLASGNYTLSNVYNSDDVVLNNPSSGTYDNYNVGTNKTVNVTGLSLSGTKAANYTLASTSTTGTVGTITAKALSILGLSGNNKTYDRSTTATLSGTSTLSGVETGDTVTLGGSYTASFGDFNVGDNKSLTVSGYTIGGTHSSNYSLTQPASLTANITPKTLTAGLTGSISKTYDGDNFANLAVGNYTLSGGISGDTVALNSPAIGSYDNKNAGTGKTVNVTGLSLVGGSAGNYQLAATSTSAGLGTINPKTLSISGISVQNKIYDGSTNANVDAGSATFSGQISGDDISLNNGTLSANFADKNVGMGKAITVSGFSLTGTDANNYALNTGSFAGATANITQRSLVITADAKTKVYGAIDPTLTYQITTGSLTAGDYFTGALSRIIGESVAGGPYAINQNTLTAGGNYTLSYVSNVLSITPAELIATAKTQSKVYGAADPTLTYTTTGLANGDTTSIFTGELLRDSGQNVGSYSINQNTLAATSNYNLSYQSAKLDISPAILTVAADTIRKVYGFQDPTLTYSLNGLANSDGGDVVSGSLARVQGTAVGAYAIVQNTISTTSNYFLRYIPSVFLIVEKEIPQTVLRVSQDPRILMSSNTNNLTYTESNETSGTTNIPNFVPSTNVKEQTVMLQTKLKGGWLRISPELTSILSMPAFANY